jgi:hypothetical protein
VIEQRLPVIARWMLFALGTVEGKRIHRPLDPVAAWLLKHHPNLLPSIPQSALLTTIRARTDLVDRLMLDEFDRARQRGERLATWSIGGGFDARWARLLGSHHDVVVEHREVESPALMDLKSRLLQDSPYVDAWDHVVRIALPEERWTIQREAGLRPLVLFETGAGRLDDEKLRGVLYALRSDAPDAHVILGLPAITEKEKRWTPRHIAALGWRVTDDLHLTNRGRLMSPNGGELCPGMYGFRLVRLIAREPLQ